MKSRPAAVAGLFYPNNADQLSEQLATWLISRESGEQPPKALLVPHAGYMYSGQIAASAYRCISKQNAEINRVVLAGPNHRVPLNGVAIPSCDQFETPLGDVVLDREVLDSLIELPFVQVFDEAHRMEHSLEVQLPFLQMCLSDFQLVPMVVGETAPQRVAELFEQLWGDRHTLFVISSDLSHFLHYEEANQIDDSTLQKVLKGDATLVGTEACGCNAVNGFLLAAKHQGLAPTLLDKCNSGDVTGDYDRVVGYASLAFYSH